MVPGNATTPNRPPLQGLSTQISSITSPCSTGNAPSTQKAGPFGAAFIRGSLAALAVPEATKNLIQDSWRPGMRSQYDSVLRGWGSFCLARETDPTLPAIADVLAYLTSLYEAGFQYNTICTARSALSGIMHIPGVARLSDHPLIQRLLKGIYHNRPPRPRYAFIWDSDKVINYLSTLQNEDLDFNMLSYKCVTLLTLLSGQRVSTLHKFKCSLLHLTAHLAQFQVVDLLKHSTPRHKQQPISFPCYPYNLHLCPVKTISHYLTIRNTLQAPH